MLAAPPFLDPRDLRQALTGRDAQDERTAVIRTPLRVLVVDDNGDAADTLGMFLEMLGYEVAVAYGSVQALALAPQVMPDVCLLDIGLPDINGYALARQLRQLPGLQGVGLAAVTGYGQARDKEAAAEAGFDMHFVKPLDDAKLQAFLTSIDTARQASMACRLNAA